MHLFALEIVVFIDESCYEMRMEQSVKPMYTKRQLLLPVIFVSALFWGLWTTRPIETLTSYRGETMGTTWSVTVYGSASIALQKGIQDELNKVNNLMSSYHPDSEVSRFNRSELSPFPLSKDTHAVVEKSIEIHKASGGVFDITLSPLITAWGFSFPPAERLPTEEDIADTLKYVGSDKLILLETGIQKTDPRLQINLSAIAKGYAVDLVTEYLKEQEQKNFLVEVGGEIRSQGTKANREWRVGIERPQQGRSGTQEIISLSNYAMATSGSYRNYKETNGTRYSHTIDPRTGRPITHALASITVLAPTCMEADAWATALNVLGTKEALSLAEEHELPIYMLEKQDNGEFAVITNDLFKYHIKQEKP